jgi:hypothetical protein
MRLEIYISLDVIVNEKPVKSHIYKKILHFRVASNPIWYYKCVACIYICISTTAL